jgi:hypothetical protein
VNKIPVWCKPEWTLSDINNPFLGLKINEFLLLACSECLKSQSHHLKCMVGSKNERSSYFSNCYRAIHLIHNKSALTEQIDDGQNGQCNQCSLGAMAAPCRGTFLNPLGRSTIILVAKNVAAIDIYLLLLSTQIYE